MLLINTRPESRATALTQALHIADPQLQVLNLPLLELTALPWSTLLAEQFTELTQVDIIVAVSPTAVELGMQGLTKSGILLKQLKQIEWIAVGQKTAECLAHYGINSHVPDIETSEGMLSLPVLQNAEGLRSVAFWRGIGGREFMMQQLQASGVHVLNMVLYQRKCPMSSAEYLKNHINLLYAQEKYAILISSEASWRNWLALIDSQELIEKGCYLVLGTRVHALLEMYAGQHQLNFQVILLEDLQPVSIQQALAIVQESL